MPPVQYTETGNTTHREVVGRDMQAAAQATLGNPYPSGDNIIRPIIIRQLNHGYTVEVGCQTIAIESSSKLVVLLSEYIYNPAVTEQKYREGKLI